MNEDELKQKLLQLLSDIAPDVDPATIDPHERFQRAFDIDSYDFLNFLVAVRDELGVSVDESDYAEVSTLDDMVSFLLPKISR